MSKTDHLAKAKQYIAKGEDYYRKAAEEIVAAMDEDPNLSRRSVAKEIGRSHAWVNDLLSWQGGKRANQPSPYSGEEYADRKAREHTKRIARQNPEAIVEAIAEAPKEAQDKIATGLVALPNKAVSTSVQSPERKPRSPKALEHQLAQTVIDLWDLGERLMDEPPPSGDTKVLMLAYAEKAERVAAGISRLLRTGELDDELRDLLAEGVEA